MPLHVFIFLIIWDLGDIIMCSTCFFCFAHKMYLFANYCLVLFFILQIKTSGFHLKEEVKELLGILMAALANIMGIVYCPYCPDSSQKLTGLFAKHVNCLAKLIGISQMC